MTYFCTDRCPDEFFFDSENNNICSKNCSDILPFKYKPESEQGKCVSTCPVDSSYIYNLTCVKECPDNLGS